jgi:disulfide bond formation protein DsbB
MHSYAVPVAGAVCLACIALLSTALYMEHVSGLVPCALCLAQRAVFALIAVAALLYLVPMSRLKRVASAAMVLSALLGVWLAGRQVWLQSLPADDVPACGPDIYVVLERFPLGEGLKTLILGSGSCAEVQWLFLGLSIPGWTLGWFVLMALAGCWLMMCCRTRSFRLFND